jgi:hypothetical protein
MHNSAMRLGFLIAAACAGQPRPAAVWPGPPLASYGRLWLDLAAEANEVSPAELSATIRDISTSWACPHDCIFEVHYRYDIGWLPVTVRDFFYIRDRRGDRSRYWSDAAQIRDSLAHGDGHIDRTTIKHVALVLHFASRADAEAAFVARFGRPPELRIEWLHSLPHSPLWEHPVLAAHPPDACTNGYVDLVTGAALTRPELCD